MKRIIRLTESDLARIVKRVISEQVSNGAKAFEAIKKGFKFTFKEGGTDENVVAKGVYMIKTKQDYQDCLALVKKAGHKTIMCWIGTEMSYAKEYDSTQSAPTKDWGQKGNNPYLRDFQRHLRQFNPSETICSNMGI